MGFQSYTFEQWNDVSGFELSGESDRQTLQLSVPDWPGVYVWRRDLTMALAGEDMAAVGRTIETTARLPSAVIPPSYIASSVFLRGIELGSGQLTDDKKRTLAQWTRTPKSARVVKQHLLTLQRFVAPLYIGSSGSLCDRLVAHLRGQTDFAKYMSDVLDIPIDRCVFSFFPIRAQWDDTTKRYVELLEFLSQRILGPAGVQRAG